MQKRIFVLPLARSSPFLKLVALSSRSILDAIAQNVKPWSQGWLIGVEAYPGFCRMKRLKVFLLPLDGMLVHRRSLPCNFVRFLPNNLPVPSYTLHLCPEMQAVTEMAILVRLRQLTWRFLCKWHQQRWTWRAGEFDDHKRDGSNVLANLVILAIFMQITSPEMG